VGRERVRGYHAHVEFRKGHVKGVGHDLARAVRDMSHNRNVRSLNVLGLARLDGHGKFPVQLDKLANIENLRRGNFQQARTLRTRRRHENLLEKGSASEVCPRTASVQTCFMTAMDAEERRVATLSAPTKSSGEVLACIAPLVGGGEEKEKPKTKPKPKPKPKSHSVELKQKKKKKKKPQNIDDSIHGSLNQILAFNDTRNRQLLLGKREQKE